MARKKAAGKNVFKSLDDFADSVSDPNCIADIVKDCEFQSTNILGLDFVLGGGRPVGRIIEIYGEPSGGKTAMAMHMAGICQRRGGKVVWIDAECTLEPKFAKAHGWDVNDRETCQIMYPNYGEQAFDWMYAICDTNDVDLIVVDSVSGLVPKSDAETSQEQKSIGTLARLMSDGVKKLSNYCRRSKTTVIFINQTRIDVGKMFGNPETTTGGKGLPFFCSIRLRVNKVEYINKESPTGIKQKLKVMKNKVAPPFREIHLNMMYKNGYSVLNDLLFHAMNMGVIEKKGPWYYHGADKIAQGKLKVLKELKSNKELRIKVKRETRKDLASQVFEAPGEGEV
jgi:recombination protein RecA